jgi:hypothetical protein
MPKMNWLMYLLIIGILALVLMPFGLILFGVTIVAGSIIGVLFFYFMPMILVLLGIGILLNFVPMPGFQYRILGTIICFGGAWALWNGVI